MKLSAAGVAGGPGWWLCGWSSTVAAQAANARISKDLRLF